MRCCSPGRAASMLRAVPSCRWVSTVRRAAFILGTGLFLATAMLATRSCCATALYRLAYLPPPCYCGTVNTRSASAGLRAALMPYQLAGFYYGWHLGRRLPARCTPAGCAWCLPYQHFFGRCRLITTMLPPRCVLLSPVVRGSRLITTFFYLLTPCCLHIFHSYFQAVSPPASAVPPYAARFHLTFLLHELLPSLQRCMLRMHACALYDASAEPLLRR